MSYKSLQLVLVSLLKERSLPSSSPSLLACLSQVALARCKSSLLAIAQQSPLAHLILDSKSSSTGARQQDENDDSDPFPLDFHLALAQPSSALDTMHLRQQQQQEDDDDNRTPARQDIWDILNDGFLWALPKRKTTPSRKRQRHTHKWLAPITNINVCIQCGSPRLLHTVCLNCYLAAQKPITLSRRLAQNEAQLKKVDLLQRTLLEADSTLFVEGQAPLGIPAHRRQVEAKVDSAPIPFKARTASASLQTPPASPRRTSSRQK